MRRVAFLLLLLLVALSSVGNAPAPYWSCAGLQVGERCERTGYGCTHGHGHCQLQMHCTDWPDTDENECLMCD